MPIMWTDTGSNYLANPTLSEEFRTALQPSARFRQFCDIEVAIGKHRGQTFQWNVYGDTLVEGGVLQEHLPMPTTKFAIGQGSVTIQEWGIGIEISSKVQALSEHDIRKIVFQTLRNNASRALDRGAHEQFDNTLLRYVATSGTAYNLDDDGTPTGNNNSELTPTHVKKITDLMQERNIPVYDGENYVCVLRPSTMAAVRDGIESLNSYTSEGWMRIMAGEVGKYSGVRFLTQTNVAAETNWTTNAKSNAAYFFGADTVTEAVACPEELRADIGSGYGREQGIAWFALLAFGITHADATSAETKKQARIIKWDTVA